jgi:hypothetical protein
MSQTYALVYQAGIANVFRLRTAGEAEVRERVRQDAYAPCEAFCAGLLEAGQTVLVFHSDHAGDVTNAEWSGGAGDLWTDRKHPPRRSVKG